MLHSLKLANGPNTVELAYDGIGLRIEGGLDVEQKCNYIQLFSDKIRK